MSEFIQKYTGAGRSIGQAFGWLACRLVGRVVRRTLGEPGNGEILSKLNLEGSDSGLLALLGLRRFERAGKPVDELVFARIERIQIRISACPLPPRCVRHLYVLSKGSPTAGQGPRQADLCAERSTKTYETRTPFLFSRLAC